MLGGNVQAAEIFWSWFDVSRIIISHLVAGDKIMWGEVNSRDKVSIRLTEEVKAHWKWVLEIPWLCLSFYLPPNISEMFFNSAPHFISIQIFQLHFLGDKVHSSSLELGRKRVELNVYESFKYFPQELLRKYLRQKIVISKVQFHHEGGLSESPYFDPFFSTR